MSVIKKFEISKLTGSMKETAYDTNENLVKQTHEFAKLLRYMFNNNGHMEKLDTAQLKSLHDDFRTIKSCLLGTDDSGFIHMVDYYLDVIREKQSEANKSTVKSAD